MLHPPKKIDTCPNCNTSLNNDENYCPNCGQKNEDIILPLQAHLSDIFESIFNWDSRLLRTLKVLFFQPGKLTNDFNNGKRKNYVSPLRLYLIASLVFFISLNWSVKNEIERVDNSIEGYVKTTEDTMTVNMGTYSLNLKASEMRIIPDYEDAQLDTFLTNRGVEPGFFNRLAIRQSQKALSGNISSFFQEILHSGSISMFFLMPVFAGLLMLFFRKSAQFYVEHLILSVHLHTLFFLLFSVTFLGQTLDLEIFNFALPILIFSYSIIYCKRVYQNGWIMTIGKSIPLGLLYLIILFLALALVSIISLLIL